MTTLTSIYMQMSPMTDSFQLSKESRAKTTQIQVIAARLDESLGGCRGIS